MRLAGLGAETSRAGRSILGLLAFGGAMLLAAVFVGPAAAQEGIEVDGGDRYTRSADVVVTTTPPPWATHVALSNRDDQWHVQQFVKPVNQPIDWNLVFGVDDRDGLKTVYARFLDQQGRESRSYSDQIVLDRARPRVLLGGVRSRGSLHQVALNAVDATSGVLAVQVAAGPGRVSSWRRFSPVFRLRMSSAPRFVRVLDRARNPGRWTRLRRGAVRQIVIDLTPGGRVSAVGAFRPPLDAADRREPRTTAPGALVSDAVRAYGRPDRFQGQVRSSVANCELRWLREGIRAVALHWNTSSACSLDHGVQDIHLRGRAAYGYGWRTDKGLRVGDPLSKLRRLYPGAQRNVEGVWYLVRRDTRGGGAPETPILRATTTSSGRVAELRVWIGGGGGP